jgi:hypothetical protein
MTMCHCSFASVLTQTRKKSSGHCLLFGVFSCCSYSSVVSGWSMMSSCVWLAVCVQMFILFRWKLSGRQNELCFSFCLSVLAFLCPHIRCATFQSAESKRFFFYLARNIYTEPYTYIYGLSTVSIKVDMLI